MPYGANRQRVHSPRKSASRKGYGRKWQRYSQRRLARFPFCECPDCVGKYTPASCTDHIEPVTGPDDPLFWAPLNHQSLSTSCHSKKTATEVNGEALRQQQNGSTRKKT